MRRILAPLAAALFLALSASPAAAQMVATLTKAVGVVEVDRGAGFQAMREGASLRLSDKVRTGADGVAQVRFYDGGVGGSDATVIDLTPDTTISLDHFQVSRGPKPQRQGLISLVTGFVRAAAHGWSNGSMFSVKAGTTVCGIRGSEAYLRFDEATGTATFVSSSGDIVQFNAADLATAIRMAATGSYVNAPGYAKLDPGDARIKRGSGPTKYVKLTQDQLTEIKRATQAADRNRMYASMDINKLSGASRYFEKIANDEEAGLKSLINTIINDSTANEEIKSKIRGAAQSAASSSEF